MLIVLCGLPGSGKSTVGRLLAEALLAKQPSLHSSDIVILRTDEIRRELFAVRTYSAEESIAVYDTMMARAKEMLMAGGYVILDATFIAAAHRATPLALARALDVFSHIVHVESSPELTHERLATRANDPSEADYAIYLRLREQFEAIEEPHTHIENKNGLSELRAAVEHTASFLIQAQVN